MTKLVQQVIRETYYSKYMDFTSVSNDGSLIYVKTGGVLLAFDNGPTPNFYIHYDDEIYKDEPFEIQIEENSPGMTADNVEWFFDNTNVPIATTNANENFTHTFTDEGTFTCIVVLHTEEGYSAMKEVTFNVEERKEEESGFEFAFMVISSILILTLVYTFIRNGKRRMR